MRAISKSDKHHIHLDMYLGQIGYRILDMVPSSVNRALDALDGDGASFYEQPFKFAVIVHRFHCCLVALVDSSVHPIVA